jgi:sulfoxide reductase heme-binding subunit YedZ
MVCFDSSSFDDAMHEKNSKLIKASLFIVCCLPLVRLIWAATYNQLGANPLEFITRNTGDWTLYFLLATLTITPLRKIMGWSWLIKLRRMLGLFAFFYAACHFLCFIWFDHFFEWSEMWRDVIKRPFITIGFIAFLLLLPLAFTSTNAMIKRVGAKRWQRIHQLIYVIALLGILHYFWMKAGKQDFAQPILYASVLSILLGLRVFWFWQKRRTQLSM